MPLKINVGLSRKVVVPAPSDLPASTCGLLDQLTPGLSTELARCFL